MRLPDIVRRSAYRASLVRGDYFVTRHIQTYLNHWVPRLVARGAAVADVGCGEQPLRPAITALGARYLGVDVEQNRAGTVEVIADITQIPLPDAGCDVVLCTEVLEHVADTAAAFAELARLLRPGGYLLGTTPFAYPLHEEPYDYVRLTPHLVGRCAKASALEVVDLTCAGNTWQLFATALDQRAMRRMPMPRSAPQRLWLVLVRLLANGWAIVATRLAGKSGPGDYYLSTLFVLRKLGAGA
ncbi:MAG TPA: class I SAM-dependent methyltransferase [Ktedonobacterales bacterium]|nr:class I SAM-dependent methyltransferase [Ktedonobacterales bacterium]